MQSPRDFRNPLLHRATRRHSLQPNQTMFSHIVVFWANPDKPNATEEILAGAEKYLRPVPGVRLFHCGKMATSPRADVVDQTYQVALNLTFDTKADQDAYQVHPSHLDFVKNCAPNWKRVVVYDFE